jgi:hypothetical protein
MSGSGSGGYIPSPSVGFNCEFGEITTNLSTIDLAVLAKLKIGAILSVELQSGIVILVDGDGETLGSVVHSNTMDLIECIHKDYIYKAKIININNTVCRVKISKK